MWSLVRLMGATAGQFVESSTIKVAEQPRYMVKSSTESNEHLQHLFNEAISQVQKFYLKV